MRDPNRIYRIIFKLAKYWEGVPDWRMGQLFENLKRYSNSYDMFYMEDEEFEKNLDEMFKNR